jgi:hypothetical protein
VPPLAARATGAVLVETSTAASEARLSASGLRARRNLTGGILVSSAEQLRPPSTCLRAGVCWLFEVAGASWRFQIE